MAQRSRGRSAVKFLFWAAAAGATIFYFVHTFRSGQLASWYYHRAAADGYAVNANAFNDATPEAPAQLAIGQFDTIDGLQAVPVKKGDRLPRNANGIITRKILDDGKRAQITGSTITVKVPWEIKMAKGFKYKDTFKHKGVRTWPWGGVWNVGLIFVLGLTLGYMAEGFTDVLGLRLTKLKHFEGH